MGRETLDNANMKNMERNNWKFYCLTVTAIFVLYVVGDLFQDVISKRFGGIGFRQTNFIIFGDDGGDEILDAISDAIDKIGPAETEGKMEESSTTTPGTTAPPKVEETTVKDKDKHVEEPLTETEILDNGCRVPTKEEMEEMVRCPSVGVFPFKKECKLYRKCYGVGNRPVFLCCPKDLMFDHILGACVPEKDARCRNITTGGGDDTKTEVDKDAKKNGEDLKEDKRPGVTAPLTDQEKKEIGCRSPSKEEMAEMVKCPRQGIFPFKDDCKLFRKCYGIGGRPIYLCCPKDQMFDHILKTCVPMTSARCINICPHPGFRYLLGKLNHTEKYLSCNDKGYLEEITIAVGSPEHISTPAPTPTPPPSINEDINNSKEKTVRGQRDVWKRKGKSGPDDFDEDLWDDHYLRKDPPKNTGKKKQKVVFD